jgi:hypothetical protein
MQLRSAEVTARSSPAQAPGAQDRRTYTDGGRAYIGKAAITHDAMRALDSARTASEPRSSCRHWDCGAAARRGHRSSEGRQADDSPIAVAIANPISRLLELGSALDTAIVPARSLRLVAVPIIDKNES